MKVLLEIKDDKAAFFMELLKNFSFVKAKKLLHEKDQLSESESEINKSLGKRKFGSGKHLIGYIADDFNDPIDHFGQSIKP